MPGLPFHCYAPRHHIQLWIPNEKPSPCTRSKRLSRCSMSHTSPRIPCHRLCEGVYDARFPHYGRPHSIPHIRCHLLSKFFIPTEISDHCTCFTHDDAYICTTSRLGTKQKTPRKSIKCRRRSHIRLRKPVQCGPQKTCRINVVK